MADTTIEGRLAELEAHHHEYATMAAHEFLKESKRAEAAEKRTSSRKPSPLKVRNAARRTLEVDLLRATKLEGLLREFVAAVDWCWNEDFDLSQTPFTQDLHDRAVAELGEPNGNSNSQNNPSPSVV